MAHAYMRGMPVEQDARETAPLITLYEREDSIAVPLLSQLRMAGYDVRSARTPVELFDILTKNLVALVLVDLGAATAGRREFWVALDAQRRGRNVQVLTFRFIAHTSDFDLDLEPNSRAIADVEVHSAGEFQRIIEAVRQRTPLNGPAPSMSVSYTPEGNIQPLGAALGIASPPFSANAASIFPNQPQGMGAYGSIPPGGFMAPQPMAPQPMAPQPMGFPAHAETTPIPPGAFGPSSVPYGQSMPQPFGQPSSQPFGQVTPQSMPQPFGQPFASSPFSNPTNSNPFGREAVSSPFAQPYDSNPFSHELSAPSTPPFPFAQTQHGVNPFSPMPQNGSSTPSAPTSWGAPSSWGATSGGYLSDALGIAGWQTPTPGPDSFGSDPGARLPFASPSHSAITYRPVSTPQPPVFQDAWTPPDTGEDMDTGALSEDAFQGGSGAWAPPASASLPRPADAWAAAISQPRAADSQPNYGMHERPWDAPRVRSDELHSPFDSSSDDLFTEPTAAVPTPISTQPDHEPTYTSTPTETALGSVLIEGSLLTPGKLDTLRGIQEMLASVNQPRKLGELAVMFKFLSSDQLLAALLVSRGLVSTQQIASLGRLKQEMALKGAQHDLASLLVSHNLLSADQLEHLRQELAS